jgi:hypothetical protein
LSESTKAAVVSAVITGIFTVLAGVVVYFCTTNEPELSYSVVGGPALSNALGAKRIFVVEVRNAGKKEVSQTLTQVILKNGELSEAASEATAGVKLTEEKGPHLIDIRADLLNPGDVVKVSFLASLTTSGAEPNVVVRAPGVKASAETSKSNRLFDLSDPLKLAAFILPVIAAVLSTFLVAARVGFFGRLPGLAGTSGSGATLDRSELVAYLCAACGLYEESHQLRFGGSEVSWRGTSDFLLQRLQQVDSSLHMRYEAALRALLQFSNASAASRKAIRCAVDSIAQSPITDAEFQQIESNRIREGDDPILWRQQVKSFVGALGLN